MKALLYIALALTMSLSACSDRQAATVSRGEKGESPGLNMTWAMPSSITSLDYRKANDSFSTLVLVVSQETLLKLDNENQIVPNLAESWEQVDGVTYVYKIRPGVKFWNGNILTAEDVAYSMSLNMRDTSRNAKHFVAVDSIEVTGALEVTVKLKYPDSTFQYIPAISAGMVGEKKFLLEHDEKYGTPNVLIMGTGPYVPVAFSPDVGIDYVRNEYYWGGEPLLDSLSVKLIGEESTRLLALRTGEIDAEFSVPRQQGEVWGSMPDVQVWFAEQNRIVTLSFDLDTPPWNDIHVRRAVSHALDQKGIARAVFGGRASPARTLIPPKAWGGLMPDDDRIRFEASLPRYDFDLKKSAAELAMSAYPEGFEATAYYSVSVYENGRILQVLASNLSRIGIHLIVKEISNAEWIERYFSHSDMGLTLVGLAGDYPDPANYTKFFLLSEQARTNGTNSANFRSSEVDSLIQMDAAATGSDERLQHLMDTLAIVANELPYAPVVSTHFGIAVNGRFDFEHLGPAFDHKNWMEQVSIAPQHRQ